MEWQIFADPTEQALNVFSNPVAGELAITPAAISGTGGNFVAPFPPGSGPGGIDPILAQGTPFTRASGLITSRRTFSQTNGTFSYEAIFPQVGDGGAFSAGWLVNLDTHKEIDMPEVLSGRPRQIEYNILSGGNQFGTVISGNRIIVMPSTWDPSVYHEHKILWDATLVAFFLDGIERYRINHGGVLIDPLYWVFNNSALYDWGDYVTPPAAGFIGTPMKVRKVRVKA
jgi:hypothetical protein